MNRDEDIKEKEKIKVLLLEGPDQAVVLTGPPLNLFIGAQSVDPFVVAPVDVLDGFHLDPQRRSAVPLLQPVAERHHPERQCSSGRGDDHHHQDQPSSSGRSQGSAAGQRSPPTEGGRFTQHLLDAKQLVEGYVKNMEKS